MLLAGSRYAPLLSSLISGGAPALQVLVDFDRTLTSAGSVTGHGVLEAALPPAARAQCAALYERYHPIEFDPAMPVAEKIPHMLEWYSLAHAAIQGGGLTRAALAAAVAASVASGALALRPEVAPLVAATGAAGVPLLIFSAGVADVIEVMLSAALCGGAPLPPHVSVVSNRMAWSAEGVHTGWAPGFVHMYNKDETALRGSHLHGELLRRRNVLLAGDSLGDAAMADGLPHAAVLKLGVLNAEQREPHMDAYTAAFDALILSRESIAPLLEVVQRVVAGGGGGGAGAGAVAAAAAVG
jgi:5'-nucleotidase